MRHAREQPNKMIPPLATTWRHPTTYINTNHPTDPAIQKGRLEFNDSQHENRKNPLTPAGILTHDTQKPNRRAGRPPRADPRPLPPADVRLVNACTLTVVQSGCRCEHVKQK